MSTAEPEMHPPNTTFVLSLIGGILIILGSIFEYWMFSYAGGFVGGMMGGFGGMMGGFGYGYSQGFVLSLTIVGLICGALVVVGAAMIRARPGEHLAWGVVVLVFSLVSFVDAGGLYVGAILGVIGGAFALGYRRPP